MHKQQSRRTCDCETMPTGRPDPRDRFREDEMRVPHPTCPVHRESDDEAGVDWQECAEFYRIALTNDGEWVDEDQFDDATGDRRAA